MRQKNIFLIICSALLCVACSSTLPSFKSYKLDIQQGNVVTSKMVEQVHKGMTKSQVKYVLGTPLIQDTFHRDRWDYFYQYRHEGKVTQQNRVILEFKDDVLVNIAGDPVPEGTIDPASMPKSDVMLEQADKRPFIEKLKFWKSGEAKQAVVNNAEQSKVSAAEVAAVVAQIEQKEATTAAPSDESVKSETTTSDAPAGTVASMLAVPLEAVAVDAAVAAAPEVAPSKVEEPKETGPVEVAANSVVEQSTVTESAVEEGKVEQSQAVADMQRETAIEEPVSVQYNSALEQPVLLLDKRLKQYSDKPIAKINATPDIPPHLILSRTLADAPLQSVPVSDASIKSTPASQVSPRTEEPGVFERMLEKIGF